MGTAVSTSASPGSTAAHRPSATAGSAVSSAAARSVLDLVDPSTGPADVRIHLTARRAKLLTSGGRTIDAWTFNGTAPGPQLTVRVGQLVEVDLDNRDIAAGVTIHWHGLDVPNAMDGVAGVTQNAVRPGQRFVYRFRPEQVGTFWYHSHQDSAEAVGRGLYGALVVLPASGAVAQIRDIAVVAHTWATRGAADQTTIGLNSSVTRYTVPTGSTVRLRLVNTDDLPQHWAVAGTAFQVLALDGNDVHGPTLLRRTTITVPAGGRVDLGLTVPDGPVVLSDLDGNRPAVALIPPGHRGALPAVASGGVVFDPASYGTPARIPFDLSSHFDASFQQVLETHHGTHNGLPVQWWTINGQRYPDIPMIMVRTGQLVRIHIVNRSDTIHPMHLHGHRVLVLEKAGRPTTGSPWWADTIELDPGQDVVVGFRADNPGVWMDHCHNLEHAAAGMMMHLAYEGVTTPFSMDPGSGNLPE